MSARLSRATLPPLVVASLGLLGCDEQISRMLAPDRGAIDGAGPGPSWEAGVQRDSTTQADRGADRGTDRGGSALEAGGLQGVVLHVTFDKAPLGAYTDAAIKADFPGLKWASGLKEGRVHIIEGAEARSGRSLRVFVCVQRTA